MQYEAGIDARLVLHNQGCHNVSSDPYVWFPWER